MMPELQAAMWVVLIHAGIPGLLWSLDELCSMPAAWQLRLAPNMPCACGLLEVGNIRSLAKGNERSNKK